jgi:hypothetical protein
MTLPIEANHEHRHVRAFAAFPDGRRCCDHRSNPGILHRTPTNSADLPNSPLDSDQGAADAALAGSGLAVIEHLTGCAPKPPSYSGRGAARLLYHRTATAKRLPGTWAGSQAKPQAVSDVESCHPAQNPGTDSCPTDGGGALRARTS